MLVVGMCRTYFLNFGFGSVFEKKDSVRNEFGSVPENAVQFGCYSYLLLV